MNTHEHTHPQCNRVNCPEHPETNIRLAKAIFGSASVADNTRDQSNETRADISLSSGRTVRHSRMSNGAQDASIVESETGEMTEAEWSEYCALIVKGQGNETRAGFKPCQWPFDPDYAKKTSCFMLPISRGKIYLQDEPGKQFPFTVSCGANSDRSFSGCMPPSVKSLHEAQQILIDRNTRGDFN